MKKRKSLQFLVVGMLLAGCSLGCVDIKKGNAAEQEKITGIFSDKTKIARDARLKNVELPSYPWHMINLWWQFQDSIANFERLDLDLTIHEDVPESYNLYISPVGIARINNISCYGGIQTNINGWSSKESRKREHFGKGIIFSRWNVDETKPIGLDYVDMKPGGLCESAGYEGEFCSIRYPFKWTAGTYTYSIVKDETVQFKDAPHTWFRCVLTSHKDNRTIEAGRLLFEGDRFSFWNANAAFMEIYATEKESASDIPTVTVDFAYPRINGKKPPLNVASANYVTEGQAASPYCADVEAKGDVISVTVSPSVRKEEPKAIPLMLDLK